MEWYVHMAITWGVGCTGCHWESAGIPCENDIGVRACRGKAVNVRGANRCYLWWLLTRMEYRDWESITKNQLGYDGATYAEGYKAEVQKENTVVLFPRDFRKFNQRYVINKNYLMRGSCMENGNALPRLVCCMQCPRLLIDCGDFNKKGTSEARLWRYVIYEFNIGRLIVNM